MSFGLSAQPSEAPPVDPYPTKVLWGLTTPTLTWECVMGGQEKRWGQGLKRQPGGEGRGGQGRGGAEGGEGQEMGGVGEGPG